MTQQQQKVAGDRGSGLRLSGAAVAGLSSVGVLGVFMAQNGEEVTVNFLTWDVSVPVWLLTLGAAVLGGLVWFGLGIVRTHRRRAERRQERRSRRRG